MEISRREMTIFALASAFAPSFTFASTNAKQLAADLRKLVDQIVLKHPSPFTRFSEREFRAATRQLERDIARLSDGQRVAKTMALVALLQDTHTYIDPVGADFQYWFPVRFYEFTDGYYITAAHRDYAELAGLRVLEIAGRPAEEAARHARSLMSAENAFSSRENLHVLSNSRLMQALGFSNGALLPLKTVDGQGRAKSVEVAARPGDRPDALGLDWRNRSEVFGLFVGEREDWVAGFGKLPTSAFRTMDANRPPHLRYRSYYYASALNPDCYYIQVNYLENDPNEGFVDFIRRALTEIDKLRPRNLIVDFRYCSGGDGSMVIPMIHEFIKREDSRTWKDLYVLSGRKSYSASLIAFRAFADHTEVSFLGEPAAGAYNHFGDPMDFEFPQSGFNLHVSTLRHSLSKSDDLSRTIQIDVPAQFSSDTYFSGRDPAVDAIVNGEEMRALPVIALKEGGKAARKTYEQRLTRYSGLDWWRACDERALNNAAYTLLRRDQIDESIAAFDLNATIFPESWNCWDSLGEAQRVKGDNVAALSSYRRSLALNPGNNGARTAIAELTTK